MDGYIPKALQRFKHFLDEPVKYTPSPIVYEPPMYGNKDNQEIIPNTAEPLIDEQLKSCREIIGTLLYYARAIDVSLLPAITTIVSELAQPTVIQLEQVKRLLAYAATFPDNRLVFRKSDMILRVHSDASYLSRSHGRSVVGGIGFLGAQNAPLWVISKILDVVVASAAESEYGGLFVNCTTAVNTRNILTALKHIQPPMEITSDNKVAVGLSNDTLKIKRSKSIDMRFHWIRDRIRQQQFIVKWAPGKDNLADFFTKALPVHVHQARLHQLMDVPNKTLHPHAKKTLHHARFALRCATALMCIAAAAQ